MKTISFQDLLKVSWLQGYSEIDLLSIEMDEQVDKVLDEIGIDTEYPILYFPCKHRTLDNKVVVGYMACGEVSCNRKHTNSPYFDITDIVIANMYRDIDYAKELAEMAGRTTDWIGTLEEEIDVEENNEEIEIEEDYDMVSEQMRLLEDIRDRIRGPLYNNSGAIKTRAEYREWLEEQKRDK